MNKQALITLLVAIALVALYVVVEKPFRGEEEPEPRPEDKVVLFTPISEADCVKIEMGGFATSQTLTRRGDRWFTRDGYRADSSTVNGLFDALENMGDPQLRSIKADQQTFLKFQVDNFLGVRLRLFDRDGNAKVDVIVGKLDREFMQTPLRRPDSGNIYMVRGMLHNIGRQPDWRDHAIVRYDMPRLRRVTVRTAGESFSVERENEAAAWHFSEPTSAPIDANAIQSWLQQVAFLRADDFVPATTDTEQLTSYGLTMPTEQLTVGLDDGSTVAIVFGGLEETRRRHYARRLDDPQIYLVSKSTHDLLVRKAEDLKPKPKPTPRPTPPVPTLPPPVPQPTTGTTPAAPSPPTTGAETLTAPAAERPVSAMSPPVMVEPPPATPPIPEPADAATTAAK